MAPVPKEPRSHNPTGDKRIEKGYQDHQRAHREKQEREKVEKQKQEERAQRERKHVSVEQSGTVKSPDAGPVSWGQGIKKK